MSSHKSLFSHAISYNVLHSSTLLATSFCD